jgi:tetratricopeptide (TPR) repeat protein
MRSERKGLGRWALRFGALALVLGMLVACGGGAGKRETLGGGVARKQKLDPIKPAARREFEAAMRAIRLGGPEASETARARLKSALSIDGGLWEAWYDLGVIAWKEGEDDEAVDDFNKALAINHDHTPILMARAEANRRAGHKGDARSDYEHALKQMDEDDPNRKDVAARLASLLRDAGDYDAAIDRLRETVRVSGASARIYTELAQIYIAQKKLELAQLVLAKAIELDQNDPVVLNAGALLALRQNKGQDAFRRFDAAVDKDPKYYDARFNKASVLLDAGDYARAKTELAEIVTHKTDDYGAMVSLGVAHRGLKEFAEAKRVWERVVKEAPRRSSARADAMWNVAILKLDFMSDEAGGKADLERYLQEAPSSHSKRQEAENKCKVVQCH